MTGQRPRITLRWEVMRAAGMHEHTFDAPDGWETWTSEQRQEFCEENLQEGLSDYVGTSYEYEGMPR